MVPSSHGVAPSSSPEGYGLVRSLANRPRVIDVERDRVAREGGRRHLGKTLRREEPVPCALRNDRERPRAQRESFGWPVLAHDFQGRAAIEDVNELVAREMALP